MKFLRVVLALLLLAAPANAIFQNNELIGFGAQPPSGGTCTEITDYSSYTKIGDMTGSGGLAASFDGNLHQASAASSARAGGANGYVGINFGTGKQVCKIVAYAGSAEGFTTAGAVNVAITLTAKNSAPASGTDGTSIGTTGTFTNANNLEETINSTDQVTSYQYVWAYIDTSASVVNSELRIWVLQ